MTEVISEQKREVSFPVLRVGDKLAFVKSVAEESRQGLAEEDTCYHQPPS